MAPKLTDNVTPPPGPDAARGTASTERVRTIPQPTPNLPPMPAPAPAQPVRQPNGGTNR
jgi:hypothetical protein